ncbi:MAG: hypothetical protein KBS67_04545 [Bacteroidales bacterium]|nr:hypothetical protein [Candidatus Cryptobacteroides equifaecalis]
MKTSYKLLAVAVIAAAALISCKKEAAPVVTELKVSTTSLHLDKAGVDAESASVQFTVESNTYWRAFKEDDCTWLGLSVMGAAAGKTTVTVSAASNVNVAPRTTKVTIETFDGTVAVVNFEQDFIDARIKDMNSPAFYGKPGTESVYPNCFRISEAGQYRFAARTPEGAKLPGTVGTWVWANGCDWDRVPAEGVNDLLSKIEFDGNEFLIEVPENFHPGNVLLAVADDAGRVLCSWHIWTTVAPVDIELGGYSWMDRNIGAAHAFDSSDDAVCKASRGFYYQWGCKNPIIGAYDSTVKAAFVEGTSAAYTVYNDKLLNVAGWSLLTEAPEGWTGKTSDPVAYPMSYIAGESFFPLAETTEEWPESCSPCPYGYHVMTLTEAKALGNSTLVKTNAEGLATTNVASVLGSEGLVFPSNGYRHPSTAVIAYAGNPDGRYWTSTPYNSTRRSYWLMNASNNKQNNAQGTCGMSVRCVKD